MKTTNSETETITVVRMKLTDDVSQNLVRALNEELTRMYPEPGANHFELGSEETARGRGAFLVLYRNQIAVGCGAIRLLDAQTGELKRMYVAPGERGKGLGRRLVLELEAEARSLGVQRLVLETGTRQLAALALYRAVGFHPVPLYGEYLRSPDTSLCMGKELPAVS